MDYEFIDVYEGRRSLAWGLPKEAQSKRQCPSKPICENDYYLGRARSVHRALLRMESSIFPRPEYFVTAIFSNEFWFKNLTSKTPKATQGRLRKLFKSYRDRFPNGFILWSIEYVPERGVHLHAACTTGENMSATELENWISSNWWRVCTFDNKRAVDVREYDHGKDGTHGGYITKAGKLQLKADLIKCFGKIRTFGVVMKKNMKRQEPVKHRILRSDMDELRTPLLRHLERCRDDIRASDFPKKQQDGKIARLRRQYRKIKSNFSLHYFDLSEDLFDVIKAALHKLIQKARLYEISQKNNMFGAIENKIIRNVKLASYSSSPVVLKALQGMVVKNSEEKISDYVYSNGYDAVATIRGCARERKQIDKVKSTSSLHYLDEELHRKLFKVLNKICIKAEL